jgi:hypothetical protein
LHARSLVVATPHRDARQLEAALLRPGTEVDRDHRDGRRAVLLDEPREELAVVVAIGAGEEEGFVAGGGCQRRDAAHAKRATGAMSKRALGRGDRIGVAREQEAPRPSAKASAVR